METMWRSLEKLLALPADTRLYCGHEYTLANGRFALSVEPTNIALQQRMDEARQQSAQGRFTLPTTMAMEQATNPFLRAARPEMGAALGMTGASAVDIFAHLRELKNKA
jgi:hydroxyacylglutathione hydrolase